MNELFIKKYSKLITYIACLDPIYLFRRFYFEMLQRLPDFYLDNVVGSNLNLLKIKSVHFKCEKIKLSMKFITAESV